MMLPSSRLQSLIDLDVFEHAFMIGLRFEKADYMQPSLKTSNGYRRSPVEVIGP